VFLLLQLSSAARASWRLSCRHTSRPLCQRLDRRCWTAIAGPLWLDRQHL